MLTGYGVDNRRVVNRPSKYLKATGEIAALAIPNCAASTWTSWLQQHPRSRLTNLLPRRYAVEGPTMALDDSPAPVASASTPSPPASVCTPSMCTPTPDRPVSIARREEYLQQLMNLTRNSGLSPDEVTHVLSALTGVEEHPASPSRSPQDLYVARQPAGLVGVSRAALTSAEWMDASNKRRMFTYYGYRDMQYHQMLCLITRVHWPNEGWDYTMSTGPSLTNLEQCLFAKMWLWKCGGRVSFNVISDQWGISTRSASRYVARWSPRWGEVGKRYSRLLVDAQFLLMCQPREFADRYPKPVSHILDGCTNATEVPRVSSLRAHLLYADKIKHQAFLALDLCTVVGLCFLCMPLYCGKCSETRYMQVHRHWLDIVPPGFARLVDKAFARTGILYKNRSLALVPSFVRRERGYLTAEESKSSAEQSSDRYVGEVQFARVKKAFEFEGVLSHKKMRYAEDAWNTAHYNSNLMHPLRTVPAFEAYSQRRHTPGR